ncbi:hypothetical protein O6H91_13G059000 [Diphasiastrum complanatum]|uniref:Uncharacterized protein n=1 Tax=Diphasiastrum complanatum TaxID=34168 RepID=A0ACC2BV92_DIPCM|nr:hypothetical protein O6H91_13G059000 [Diphasiastrum complanatum]
MVLKLLVLHYKDLSYTVEFETELGVEVLKHQIYSLTSVLPDDQQILGFSSTDDLFENGLAFSNLHISTGGHITLVEKEKMSASLATSAEKLQSNEMTDEELARILQAEEDALYIKEQEETGKKSIKARLDSYCKQVFLYEDPERQDAARKSLPLFELEEKAAVALAKTTKDEFNHSLLLQLLFWFKQSFRWINSLPCAKCGFLKTNIIGPGAPNTEELRFGGNRVELFRVWSKILCWDTLVWEWRPGCLGGACISYSCSRCGAVSRFPRYNDPVKLLQTRSGRCGEWANCFTFYCRSLGYQARLVMDFTDHVWTECFSTFLGRWVHLDPCESSFDKPLLYEKGWGKQLNYIFAFAKDGIYDVTRRYTRNWPQVLSRRDMLSESALQEVLGHLTSRLRREYPLTEQIELQRREIQELQEMHAINEECDSLQGRQSGSQEWRISRGETGMMLNQLQSSKPMCLRRLCIDEHVGKFFKTVGRIYCDINAAGLLKSLQELLHTLHLKPYKTRHVRLGKEEETSDWQAAVKNESVQAFFGVLGFGIVHENKEVWIRLNEIPSKAALALPVAMELLESVNAELQRDLSITDTKKPMLKFSLEGTRLASGFTLASGEEPPLGIATSAFDGLHSTKWEEPDGGANGAWITYELPKTSSKVLIEYELTSANDCPERDPCDWVLEGSDDDGKSWKCLDSQVGQLFEHRFEKKLFKIPLDIQLLCHFYRFRFTRVQDQSRTGRLQVACIDLYAKEETSGPT